MQGRREVEIAELVKRTKLKTSVIVIVISLIILASAIAIKTYYPAEGLASIYSNSLSGKKTANGEIYNPGKLTAAHRSLPFGTKVKVTNLENKREVTVRINDRGPYKRGRIIDLSYVAARQLDMLKKGIVKVRIKALR